MIEDSEEFLDIRPSKSMSSLPLSIPNIDTKIIKQVGNYTLGVELGSGAFGKVVLGKHIITGETVAIKILDKIILNQTPEDYELVKKEMSILKLVKHKYIIQLYEILQTPNHIFIVMEYCDGKDIMDYILSKNFLSESDALKYFQQLINALFYLHSQNIAHRDIKIDNILLDRNKNLKLIDFGLSTKYSDNKLLDQPCGTIVYSAPEVLEGQPYHGMLADVWSSGIVLYGMLSGYLPFSDNDDNVNKKLIIEGKIEMPENISPWVTDLLRHMLDVNPMTRYTLQDIKDHPWFNMNDYILIQGIIIGYHKMPVDESILDCCANYNFDKNKVRDSVINNKFDSGSALYYLLVRQRSKKGISSVSDLSSDKFIQYIYNEKNLINNNKNTITKNKENKNKNESKNKEEVINDKNDKIKKNESNLSAAPGLFTNIVTTPKKHERKQIISKERNSNKKINTSNNNISKKNKKIKLFSSINKKSISKIKKSNNFLSTFFEETKKTEINLNTYKIYQKNKIKNKINTNVYNPQNKNYLNSHNINNHRSKIKHNKNNYSPNLKEKFVIKNKKRTPIKIKRKEKDENSFVESTIPNDRNLQLSLKELCIQKNIEDEYKSTTNSNVIQKHNNSKERKNYSKNRTQQLPKSYKKMIKINEIKINKISNKNISTVLKHSKTNDKLNYKRNNDNPLINKFKMSRSIENIDNKTETNNFIVIKINNNINNISNKNIYDKSKSKSKSKSKIKKNNESKDSRKNNKYKYDFNSKNTTPMNKILRNTINYLSNLSNNISSANSQDKKKFKTNIKLQTRNDGSSQALSNYTKSCSYSTNNINTNSNKNNLAKNNKSSKKMYNSNFSNYNNMKNNKKLMNIKQKLSGYGKYDISYNFMIDNAIKNKSPLINYQREEKIKNNNKTFYNNNIKLIKNSKMDILKKSSIFFGINNSIINKINNRIQQKIKQPQILQNKNIKNDSKNKNNNNFNSVMSIIKHKNMINMNNHNIKTDNISTILSNSKPQVKIDNLTSPNQNKAKPKIKHCHNNNSIEKLNNINNNKKNSNNKRNFESSVITYRYHSPIITRDLSESPKQKFLNEKTRHTQMPWKIKKKGIDEKLPEEIIYQKYIHKIKKNPFIINNNKINKNKNKEKNKKVRASSNHRQKSDSLNKSKTKNKIKYNDNIRNKISTCFSKDNLYKNVMNINYRLDSPSNNSLFKKSKIKESNNQSLNFFDIKTFPLINAINKKHKFDSNKRIYHRNFNNFNMSNTNNTNNTNNNNNYNNYTTSMSMNSIAIIKEKEKENNNKDMLIFDLSCVIIGKNNINECCNHLINKFKKNGVSYFQRKNNVFIFHKNGVHYEIEIIQLFDNEDFSYDNNKIYIY